MPVISTLGNAESYTRKGCDQWGPSLSLLSRAGRRSCSPCRGITPGPPTPPQPERARRSLQERPLLQGTQDHPGQSKGPLGALPQDYIILHAARKGTESRMCIDSDNGAPSTYLS